MTVFVLIYTSNNNRSDSKLETLIHVEDSLNNTRVVSARSLTDAELVDCQSVLIS